MKIILAAIAIGGMALLAGCDNGNSAGAGETPSLANPAPGPGAPATTAAMRYQWRQESIAIEKEVARLAAEHKALKEQAANATGQTKAALESQVDRARVHRDVEKAVLEDWNAAAANPWQRFKGVIVNALDTR